ncbi:MAG: disulfide oxidoreductase [Sulfurimonas sp.]|uniref:disulfide oxidoreductase n=1 Tax=Sulfurimonas sp. TaxID=2022749 RepID=UPI0026239E3D|nr:disulfide oxidoreductase [Sulfurimonas sp.]MCW8894878.1 disulfide oxidoreductase [Sulfurimonas sp.]MCW8953712.1 disulfide oxidoreductase [Sulfurimonas sp.]MCW9067736.1 disulfide oxidoreductase [Sulfurimonas sp.]
MKNDSIESSRDWNIIFFAWLVATIATLGSLFFSEVMEYPPCILCWYQRILMYPLVIILLVGLFPLDKNILKYSAPFVVIGWLTALYHNLLQYGIISKSITPCAKGIPCSTKYINFFGFISIPMLSFIAFSIILALLFLFLKRKNS